MELKKRQLVTRSDLNPFYANRYPIIGIRDLADYFSYLTKYLHVAGVITDLGKFMEDFDEFVETKESCKGTLEIREYNANSKS